MGKVPHAPTTKPSRVARHGKVSEVCDSLEDTFCQFETWLFPPKYRKPPFTRQCSGVSLLSCSVAPFFPSLFLVAASLKRVFPQKGSLFSQGHWTESPVSTEDQHPAGDAENLRHPCPGLWIGTPRALGREPRRYLQNGLFCKKRVSKFKGSMDLVLPSNSILSIAPNLSRKPPLKPRENNRVFGKNDS